MHKVFQAPELGLEVEIGKHARQADGSAWIKAGNNIVLTCAVATKEAREFAGFFPLTVEYRERTSAAGRIPGGYIKREGKLSDVEVLTSRLIDRPIRPLFPPYFFNDVQVMSTVYSSDGSFPISVLALISASIALTVSDIPFLGPIGAVQIGRLNGKWIFNASHEDLAASDVNIMIAGTKAGICMVEGHCANLSETEIIDLLFQAHEIIKKQVDWQLSIAQELNVKKRESADSFDWDGWKAKIKQSITHDVLDPLFKGSKQERADAMDALTDAVKKQFQTNIEAGEISKAAFGYLFDAVLGEVLPDAIAAKGARVDGRALNVVRDIFVEVGSLPCVHGSSIFQRGETQVLSSVTLGTGQDAQKVEFLLGGTKERTFMLHYNFPPFATGEVKPSRAAGRREIGHGYLAETSIAHVLPSQEEFPYTVRSVVDVLESNGSSSMATVCATTMALMDAGVPIKGMVAGIAMGLLRDSQGGFHVLTDILGMEDGLGLMDFKVAGTAQGITAFQLDIKDKVGLPRELMVKALDHARIARLHILERMTSVMSAPRTEISKLAPRVFAFKIPQDKIGMVIGPSGKNIKEIVATTGTQIDIEDDGTVRIYSKDGGSASQAESWIRTLTGDIEVGAVFQGTVKRIVDFGIFVELVGGKEGLIHVSSIARNKQDIIDDLAPMNGKLEVKVVAYDRDTGRVRLVAPSLEKP